MKYTSITQMNLELTTACPLRCPQCYCTLEGAKHLDFSTALHRIDEALSLGLKSLNLSGGETLCYPHLFEIIEYASSKGVTVHVALSGAYFNQVIYEKLVHAGITEICISLNGSTEEINAISRSGYDLAIRALSILKENHFDNITLNWVMHSTNSDDFPNIISLAEKYNVRTIDIIGFKPDSQNQFNTVPTKDQIVFVSSVIKSYRGNVKIRIETCYSNFLAYHSETKLFGNLNVSENKGCSAGRNIISINVDGEMTPCRHINVSESFQDMEDYWFNSVLLAKLRNIEDVKTTPCTSCKFNMFCRHCQAIPWQTEGLIKIGYPNCPVFEKQN